METITPFVQSQQHLRNEGAACGIDISYFDRWPHSHLTTARQSGRLDTPVEETVFGANQSSQNFVAAGRNHGIRRVIDTMNRYFRPIDGTN